MYLLAELARELQELNAQVASHVQPQPVGSSSSSSAAAAATAAVAQPDSARGSRPASALGLLPRVRRRADGSLDSDEEEAAEDDQAFRQSLADPLTSTFAAEDAPLSSRTAFLTSVSSSSNGGSGSNTSAAAAAAAASSSLRQMLASAEQELAQDETEWHVKREELVRLATAQPAPLPEEPPPPPATTSSRPSTATASRPPQTADPANPSQSAATNPPPLPLAAESLSRPGSADASDLSARLRLRSSSKAAAPAIPAPLAALLASIPDKPKPPASSLEALQHKRQEMLHSMDERVWPELINQ
jgi:hypothetical protein